MFTAIFTVELVLRVMALGFVLHRYSYLRDPWNWLDFIVVLFSFADPIRLSHTYSASADTWR